VKKFENRSIFGEDMDQSIWLTVWSTLYAEKLTYFKQKRERKLVRHDYL